MPGTKTKLNTSIRSAIEKLEKAGKLSGSALAREQGMRKSDALAAVKAYRDEQSRAEDAPEMPADAFTAAMQPLWAEAITQAREALQTERDELDVEWEQLTATAQEDEKRIARLEEQLEAARAATARATEAAERDADARREAETRATTAEVRLDEAQQRIEQLDAERTQLLSIVTTMKQQAAEADERKDRKKQG